MHGDCVPGEMPALCAFSRDASPPNFMYVDDDICSMLGISPDELMEVTTA
jgi:hypothetical protein